VSRFFIRFASNVIYLVLFVALYQLNSPNSCAQVQVADIGIMGAPAKKMDPEKGKPVAVPGCKIFVGGRIGEDAHLALEPYVTGIPIDSEDLVPTLVDILKKEFGAVDKEPEEEMVTIDE
jgi:ferredoxin-nitrite reductase